MLLLASAINPMFSSWENGICINFAICHDLLIIEITKQTKNIYLAIIIYLRIYLFRHIYYSFIN